MDDLTGTKVLIVGAGPAGICASMALANLGASVTVCEMRPEDTFTGTSKRSYVIILQDRGLNALEAAGFTNLKNPESRCRIITLLAVAICAAHLTAC